MKLPLTLSASCLLFLARSAVAQAAPGVTLVIENGFNAMVEVTGAGAVACRVIAGGEPNEVCSGSGSCKTAQVGLASAPQSPAEYAVYYVALGNEVQCREGDGTYTTVAAETDWRAKGPTRLPVTVPTGGSLKFLSVFPPIARSLGAFKSCGPDVDCEEDDALGSVRITSRSAATRQAELEFSKGQKFVVKLGVCDLSYQGPSSVLLSSVDSQTGTLSGTSECLSSIINQSARAGGLVYVGAGQARIRGRLNGSTIVLYDIPDLAPGPQTFDLRAQDQTLLAAITATVAPGPYATAEELMVRYTSAEVATLHDGNAVSGWAVAHEQGGKVRNMLPVHWGSELRVEDYEWEFCGTRPPEVSTLEGLPHRISFEVRYPSASPLHLDVCAYEKGPSAARESKTVCDPRLQSACASEGPDERTKEPVIKKRLVVAKAARRESLPLPIRDRVALEVTCGVGKHRKPVTEGRIRVEHGAVVGGTCEIKVTCNSDQAGCEVLGTQVLQIGLSDNKGHSKTQLVTWSPSQRGEFPLPVPPGMEAGGLYVLTVEVAARTTGGVVYRSGVESLLQSGSTPDDGKFKTTVELSDEGPTAVGPMRLFITIPVNAAGIRFPANARELASSEDQTGYQLVGPRAGLLLSGEAWDFTARRHAWDIPLRFQFGGMFYSFSDADKRLYAVAGVSAALPLVEAPAAYGSALTLSLMWEKDMAVAADQDHFATVFIGANIFSLFASQ